MNIPDDQILLDNTFELRGQRLRVLVAEIERTVADYRGVRVGPLCRQALDYCRAPAFQQYLHEHHGARGCTQHYAAVRLKEIIGRPSRKAIDHEPQPRQRFLRLQGEYRRWLQEQKSHE